MQGRRLQRIPLVPDSVETETTQQREHIEKYCIFILITRRSLIKGTLQEQTNSTCTWTKSTSWTVILFEKVLEKCLAFGEDELFLDFSSVGTLFYSPSFIV